MGADGTVYITILFVSFFNFELCNCRVIGAVRITDQTVYGQYDQSHLERL